MALTQLFPPQLLLQLPKVHQRTFVFLITFMQDLLKHSEENGLDPKLLGMASPSI